MIVEKADVLAPNVESRKCQNKVVVGLIVLLVLCGVFLAPWFHHHFKQALPDGMEFAPAVHHQ